MILHRYILSLNIDSFILLIWPLSYWGPICIVLFSLTWIGSGLNLLLLLWAPIILLQFLEIVKFVLFTHINPCHCLDFSTIIGLRRLGNWCLLGKSCRQMVCGPLTPWRDVVVGRWASRILWLRSIYWDPKVIVPMMIIGRVMIQV